MERWFKVDVLVPTIHDEWDIVESMTFPIEHSEHTIATELGKQVLDILDIHGESARVAVQRLPGPPEHSRTYLKLEASDA